MKKALVSLCVIAVFMILITGCERPATSSNWSPIEDANATEIPSTLAEAPGAETNTPMAGTGLATTGVTETSAAVELPDELPSSMKGYELYSWQVGEEWHFTLITATNAMVDFEEIIAPGNTLSDDGFVKITVIGVDAAKELLGLLPAGEYVFWGGMDLGDQVPAGTVYLTLPPQEVIDEISSYCSGLGLNLTTIQPQ